MFQGLTTAQFNAHISYASATFLSHASAVYQIPNGWSPSPADVGGEANSIVAVIAGYRLLAMRGIDKTNNSTYEDMYRDALRRLDDMEDNRIHLPLPLINQAIVQPIGNYGSLATIGGVISGSSQFGRD